MHVNNGMYLNYLEHDRFLYLHQVCQWDFSTIGLWALISTSIYEAINFINFLMSFKPASLASAFGTTSLPEQALAGKK
jgi:hypothetical protein